MGQIDFKGDRSWLIIIALFFFIPPLGIIALIAKILFTIYKNQNTEESASDFPSYERRPAYKDTNRYDRSIKQNRSKIEEAKDDYSLWKEKIEAQKPDKNYGSAMSKDVTETEDLEEELNKSLEELNVQEPVEVNADYDLTVTDVHIDTEITFEDEPEDHDHEGETPLKITACRMCGTENRIYKIDIFETPTCEKCGMLLLDRG